MGVKYYRASEKPDKIRKRLTMSRYWFRDLKWVAYFAHPKGVPGHPFKGGYTLSTGLLEHPDMKRFEIGTCFYFKPVTPCKNPYDHCKLPPTYVPFLNPGMQEQFSGKKEICSKIVKNLKSCDEQKNDNCYHYQQLFVNKCTNIKQQIYNLFTGKQ